MRWSFSTKIFLGFTAIIFAFGTVGLYGIFRMQELRRNVELVRRGGLPLTADLASLLRDLKVYEEELSGTTREDLLRLRSYFPSFKPFDGLGRLERRIHDIAASFDLEASEEKLLESLQGKLVSLRTSGELRASLEQSPDPEVRRVLAESPGAGENADVYEALARAFIADLHADKLEPARALQDELAGIMRRIRNEVAEVRREARRFLSRVDRVAETAESRARLVVAIATGIALFIAVSVMIWVAVTLRPLRRLREGVRRVAEGDFTEVDVEASDEIGQLQGEFNRMAKSLAERDRELARQREELLRSERLATIGKMSSQITHEIRNPLSSIGLNTELLEEELQSLGDASEALALCGAIRNEVGRLAAVTEQYLRFARLPKPVLKSEDINALLGELLAFMREELSTRGIAVALDVAPDLPAVPLDEDQMRQAVLNLVRNSIEAMPGGGGLTVRTRAEACSVVVTVADTGQGIEPAIQAKIFDPFFSTKATGTGLGLPLVQQIVQEHGGTLTCTSAPGEGTTFTLTLPLSSTPRLDL